MSRLRWACAGSLVAVVAFGVFLTLESGTPAAQLGSDLVLEGVSLLAAWCCFRAARRGGEAARGWRLLGVGALVWAAGNAVWTVYGITRDFAYPFPSIADLGFVGWALPAAAGLLSFPRDRERLVFRARTGLDALLIATAVLFVSWATVLGPLYRSDRTDLLTRVTGLAYPIVDITIASMVLALGMRRPRGARLPWVFLGGGLVTLAVSDSIYVNRSVAGVFTSGTILYVGWLVAFLLVSLATLVPDQPATASRSTRLGRGQEVLPYLPFAVALAVAAGGQLDPTEDPFLVASGITCLLVFGVRQALIVTENLALGEDLEAKVEARTAELNIAEGRFRSLVQNSSDLILVTGRNGLTTYVSPSAEAMLGHRPESLQGTDWYALVHPEDRPALQAYVSHLGDSGDARACATARLRHADGSWRETEVRGRDQVDDPAVAGVVLNVRDTTERQRAERVRVQLAAIVESSDDAILSTTLDGVILSWNSAADRLYGYTADEAVGKSISILVPEDRPNEVREILAKASSDVSVDHFESVRVRKDGSLVPVSLTISPVHDAAGNVVAVSTFARDVTARRAAEVTLAMARDEALAASRTKSEFLATMSHEIRTPMNGVIGLTGLLLDTELSEIQRHHAEGVRSSGEALLGIINDILDFSKIEAGKLELETVDFDLSHAVEEVAALVAESARAKGLELVAYCRPEVPTALRGDVGRLRQVLLNFATNAVKFTEAGEVVVRASLAEEPTAERVVVRLEVTDTGMGVDRATAERLFEPFSQADASTTRRYGGSGLGLAICRRLAEAMGGTVGVDSQPGRGSTFWLRLPLERASGPLDEPDRATHWLEGRRVLVVDDNHTNRLVLAAQLRAWDIAVDVARDGKEALQLLGEAAAGPWPYDLALLDMCMANMNGLELAERVRADPMLAQVRLLLLSSEAVEAEAAIRAGFVARLTKPVRLSALYDALVRAVAPSAEMAAQPSSPVAAAGPRGTLLIVEDHAINQEVAKGIAATLGYGCDVAGDGVEALKALELRRYDGVLMDCHMPVMDGFQATTEIRRREAGLRRVPIIAMTAGAMVEDREKCMAAGMDDFLSKPVKASALEPMLDKWLHSDPDQPPTSIGEPDADGDGVLDAAQFDGLRRLAAVSDDPGFLRSMVDQYHAEASAQTGRLQDASARGDAPAVRQVAHRLKGTSATMGAIGVAQASADIEQAATQGDVPTPERLDGIAAQLQLAITALEAQAAAGSSPRF